MAKKKTENIKAAPVLRADVGGDEPTPTPEQTGTRTYQIMDPWKDRDVVNLVDVKAVDGEITEVKVNGEPAGGGGGSLGTATVIVKNNYRNYATVYSIQVNPDGQLTAVSNSMMSGQTTTFIRVAVLGDKILFTTEYGRTMVVTSGSAQMKSNTEAIITGDCSLTITA